MLLNGQIAPMRYRPLPGPHALAATIHHRSPSPVSSSLHRPAAGGGLLLMGRLSSPRHACFLIQQAAEKALKAVLVLEGIEFPFTHDLDALRNLLPDSWPVRTAQVDLTELTEWGWKPGTPGLGRSPLMRMHAAPSPTRGWSTSLWRGSSSSAA